MRYRRDRIGAVPIETILDYRFHLAERNRGEGGPTGNKRQRVRSFTMVVAAN